MNCPLRKNSQFVAVFGAGVALGYYARVLYVKKCLDDLNNDRDPPLETR